LNQKRENKCKNLFSNDVRFLKNFTPRFALAYIISCINNQLNIFIMKKVILSISAMLFVGAAAFAQGNTSSVNQVGNSDQGIVNQNGQTNASTIDQLGNTNKSEVYQGIMPGVYNAKSNMADVKQKGDNNGAFISQSNHDNKAYQTQTGNSNGATIWQDQIAPPASALGGWDKATQTQTGNYNSATVDQGTTGNEKPTGLPFNATQLGYAAAVSVPFAPHSQNEATQTQNGDNNVAYASQGGVKNKSWQTQTSPTGTSAADKNVSNHYQYGNENEAKSTQTGTKLTENTLQIGDYNKATVTQTGASHSSISFSKGNSNTILVTQSGM
jgi:hypothetical protein